MLKEQRVLLRFFSEPKVPYLHLKRKEALPSCIFQIKVFIPGGFSSLINFAY